MIMLYVYETNISGMIIHPTISLYYYDINYDNHQSLTLNAKTKDL